ncbi:MAG: FtsW/RodA/SpoVE family cell cycle protein [Propionibacteriaceae bacterium]|jgi:cell division protein FtsW (lipid II flippase)|nr:FtsW/RodA/SpoVE family cell cycle protein [Propionibacteriaceae bacterium]
MDEVVVYRQRRGIEAVLLLLAIAVAVGGYFLIHLDIDAELPTEWPAAVVVLTTLALVAHLVIRWRIPYADPIILPCVMLLNGLGLAMIHRLDLGGNERMHSAELQLGWTAVAVAVFCAVIFALREIRTLNRFWMLLFIFGMVLLLLPLVPGLGVEKNGSQIWIRLNLGFGAYSFQPAELAKIVLTIAFAAYLAGTREALVAAGRKIMGVELPRLRDFAPLLLMWLASLAVLVFQKDLGTSLLFFGLFVVMLFVSTERLLYPILGAALFAGGAYAGFLLFTHVQTRVLAWLDPFADYDRNYQIITAQFGMAWGGSIGTGWGLGRPNLTPLAKTDFIAAAFGEELGVAGLSAIIMVYAIIVARGIRAALGSNDSFGKLLASGLSFVFAIQVFTIIAGVTRLLPLTGLTTPFMSQGGSSLVANWATVALLLIVTHHARRPQTAKPRDPVVNLASDETIELKAAA